MTSQVQNISELLKTLLHNNVYEKAVQQATKKYKIKHYRIEKLKPSVVKNLLKKASKMEKIVSLEQNNYAWAQGQLKIFIWLLVGYSYIKNIEIGDLNQQDFIFFTKVFEGYSIDFLNYQTKFLLKCNEKVLWTAKDSDLLNKIFQEKFQQKNWNTVAYQLYLNSQKTVFRTPKQCRERWLNHEDPAKIHTDWNSQEDVQLLRFIKYIGKKWSQVARQMNSTRTEHMVKNRYTSLIKKAAKIFQSTNESELLENFMKLKISQLNKIDQNFSNQESMIDEVQTPEKSAELQFKEFQNLEEEYFIKANQKQLEEAFPCNLIVEQNQIVQVYEQDMAEMGDFVDFFQKDNNLPIQNYLDSFY